MAPPNRGKRALAVTTKPRTARRRIAREWKIDTLARLVRFAYDKKSGSRRLTGQFDGLVRVLPAFHFRTPKNPLPAEAASWMETLRWSQAEARAAVEKAASKEEWELTAGQLADADPGLTWHAVGGRGHWDGAPRAIWLLTIRQILAFNQGFRIRVCAEAGCPTIFVGRTTSRYCDRHSSSAEKVRRYRERIAKTLSPIERKERRRRYYENWLAKHKGKAVAAVAGRRRRARTGKERNS